MLLKRPSNLVSIALTIMQLVQVIRLVKLQLVE